MKNFIIKYSYMLPVILLAASFFTAFFENYDYVLLGNLVGYSIMTDILFVVYFTFNKKFCVITRLSPLGLTAINVVDIVGNYTSENFYNFWYVVCISFIVVFFSSLFILIKK